MQGADPLGAQPHLAGRLLAGDHQRRVLGGRRPLLGHVEQQGGLADAGLAGEQHHRAGHQAAAEHPVELGDAGRPGPGRLGVDVGDRPGRRGDRPGGTAAVTAQPTGAAPTSPTEPHAWHSGQRPTHAGGVCPHSAHR